MSRTCVPPPWRPQVQLCETRRELQELKASLRVAQKEKEHLLMEKQVSVVVWSQHTHTHKKEKKTDVIKVQSSSAGSDQGVCVDLGNWC